MGWIKRKIDEHVCKKPDFHKDVATGDIWQCDECNLKYRVAQVHNQQFDQRENEWYGGSLDWESYVTPSYSDWRD